MSSEVSDWQTETCHAIASRFKKFNKKHSREYASLFANLNKIVGLLRSGHKLGVLKVGFFRSEGGDVYRIGQTGIPSPQESRLYVYPDQDNKIMYVLSIGGKQGQSEDIAEAKKLVEAIKLKHPHQPEIGQ